MIVRKGYGYSGGVDGSDYIELSIENSQMWNNNYELNNERPTYTDNYDAQYDALLEQILNRDKFSYNALEDPLYQQYKQQYQREGDRAMQETLAEAAAGAGGMNSWAITAAQQAQNYYGSQLNDKIPELYQLAYQMYLQDIDNQVRQLGILQNASDRAYNRYRDTMSDWQSDRNFAYGLYQDDVAQGQWQQTFDYNSAWADKEWDYNVGRDTIADSRYDTEQADAKISEMISLGQTPSAELIAQSSWSEADVDLMVAAAQAQLAKKNTSTGSTGSYKPSITFSQATEAVESGNITQGVLDAYNYYHQTDWSLNDFDEDGNLIIQEEEETGDIAELDDYETASYFLDLGMGPKIDNELLDQLVAAKLIYLGDDGKLHWIDGVNANNYQQHLISDNMIAAWR